MATLRYSQIRSHPGGTLRYIANKDKVISLSTHDIYNVLNYMGEPKSVERVYSFSRHCSQNPELAESMIALHRAQYFANKKGGVQGLADNKEELLGLHFFMSYTEQDDPSEETMNEIVQEISKHPKLADFAVFAANHFDQTHKHTHFFVNAYSAYGQPRKLCMRKDDYNEIRKYANKLCVERGLSIIDLAALRWNDPEYSTWVDSVIAEENVTVHPEKMEHKRKQKQNVSTKQLYYKWLKEREEYTAEEERMLTDRQRQKRNFEFKYYYTPDGDENKRWYVSGDPQERFYAIPIYSKEGFKRSLLEQLGIFILTVADKEGKYIKTQNSRIYNEFRVEVDQKLQGMYDALCTAKEMNIHAPNEVAVRIADVGKQMNCLRSEKKRHEKNIVEQRNVVAAYEFCSCRDFPAEGVQQPQQTDSSAYKEAYAVLVQNQILTTEAYAALRRRYEFAQRKVNDYDKRMRELNKQYHDLKRLEAVIERPVTLVTKIFEYSEKAATARNVDDIIASASERTRIVGNGGQQNRERECG